MRVFCTVFLMLWFLSSQAGVQRSLRFHSMPETSYYGGIHSIVKDDSGRLWFSSYDAVYMYNGNSFTKMNSCIIDDAPADFWTFGNLEVTSTGKLYVASNHGLYMYNPAKSDFVCICEGNIGAVMDYSPEGDLWFLHSGSIKRLTDKEEMTRVYELPTELDIRRNLVSLKCTGGRVYAYEGNDIMVYNPETESFCGFIEVVDSHIVTDIVDSGEEILVLTTMGGLYKYSADGKIIGEVDIRSGKNGAKGMYMDKAGMLWIASLSGLFLLDCQTGAGTLYESDLYNPYSLPNNSIWTIYPDPDSGIWIGTYGGKLTYTTVDEGSVTIYKAIPGGLNHKIVSCFAEDSDRNIWCGTEGGGISVLNPEKGFVEYFTSGDKSGLASNMVKRLYRDAEGNMLVSTFNGGLQIFDRKKRKFRNINRGGQLSIYDFLKEHNHGYWVSDPDRNTNFISQDGTVTSHLFYDPVRELRLGTGVETMYHDKSGHLCLVTHDGLYVIDAGSRSIIGHYYINDMPYSANNLCCYCKMSNGDVWLGTRGNGVNVLRQNGSYYNYTDDSGENLSGLSVYSILEDKKTGDIWLSTDGGLFVCDAATGRFARSKVDGENGCGVYYVRSGFVSSSGYMFFGGTDGFISFNPSKLISNKVKPKVFLTDILVNNERQSLYDAHYKLSHRQSNVEIKFSSSNYLDAQKNTYAYRMLGLSENWVVLPQGQKAVQFFNLSPGNYTFEIKTANNDGLWSDEVTSVSLRIKPSPFLSVWAYICYVLLLISIAYMIVRFSINRKLLENELEMERQREEDMRALTKVRIKFFTNISHDLKTPLTLVIEPLRQLKSYVQGDKEALKQVNLIERSVLRIQHIISQLLQFREIESQKITMNPEIGDLVHFTKDIFSLFEAYASSRNIETALNSSFESLYARFDHDVVEKIITNLFSNAVKYTPSGGFVGVDISEITDKESQEEKKWVSICVTNTGVEILKESQETLFKAFRKIKAPNFSFESSTGLGLAIVKELTQNLGGEVVLTSEKSKVRFDLRLPLHIASENNGTDDKKYEYTVSEIDNLILESADDDMYEKGTVRKTDSIVVVEDDVKLRNYLESRLSKKYNVYTAINGSDGIVKTEKVNPQVVITDLVMPQMGGFELCRRIKSNVKTSHIPVIVLSAMENDDDKVRAMDSGASVFISKPVNVDFLFKQIDNLINARKEMREMYSKKYIAEPSKMDVSSEDEAFLSKAVSCIERNMDNSDYDVETFVSDMAIGRTILYRKLKEITGQSIKEFIMDVRLKRAIQLMQESKYTIAEISFMTGFVNPKYFSVCFKRRLGKTPTEFKKEND